MADRRFPDVIILFFLSGAVNSKAVTQNGILNGSFTLDPGITGIPTYILWKHGSDKAVEWDTKSDFKHREFREFKDKSSLNNITGELTVRGLTKALSGRYNAEFIIQGKLVKFTQEVEVHDPVPQPVVSCVKTSSTTTLHCSAKGHPLQYHWSGPGLEGATWSPMYNVTVITTAEPGNYRCEVKNAVSEKRQDFNTKDCGSAGNLPIILGIVLGVLVCILIAATLLYCFMKRVKRKGSEDPEQPTHHETKTSIHSSIPSSIPPSHVAAALQTPDRDKDGPAPIIRSSPTEKIPATKQGGREQDESQPLLQEIKSNDKPESKGFVKRNLSVKETVKEREEGKLVSPRKDQNEGMTQQMCQDSPVGSLPAKPPRALTTEKRSSTDRNVKQADERGEEREKTDEGKEERTEKTDKGGDTQEEGMSKEVKEKDNEKEGEDERENRQNGEKEEEGRKDEKGREREGKERSKYEKIGKKENGKEGIGDKKEEEGKDENKEGKENETEEDKFKENKKDEGKEEGEKDEGKEEENIPKSPPADILSTPTATLMTNNESVPGGTCSDTTC